MNLVIEKHATPDEVGSIRKEGKKIEDDNFKASQSLKVEEQKFS